MTRYRRLQPIRGMRQTWRTQRDPRLERSTNDHDGNREVNMAAVYQATRMI